MKQSMNARIKAVGLVGVLFVAFSCVYFEIVIKLAAGKIPVLEEIHSINKVLVKSNNLTEINLLLD